MGEKQKYATLLNKLTQYGKITVAFSGGVDSTFLLIAAQQAVGKNVIGITIASPYIAQWEIEEAKQITKEHGIQHKIITVPYPEIIRKNPSDRCYLCKTIVFTEIKKVASSLGFPTVCDGTNFDDTKDYRPGLKALKELDIKSPLKETQLTKDEIRALSHDLNLNTWDKPAYACLLTRIPYDTHVDNAILQKIESAESFLMKQGFRAVRVRVHNDVARIEVPPEKRAALVQDPLSKNILKEFKRIGFQYVTVDICGYRMGSLNNNISTK